MRGTADKVHKPVVAVRFIPACAGNRERAEYRTITKTVHPRVCGEQSARPEWRRRVRGSSPRVRGTVRAWRPYPKACRFIPACAGNRLIRRLDFSTPTVHPRVCGEQLVLFRRLCRCYGSSPRVRGTAIRTSLLLVAVRFIPACAGNRGPITKHSSCRSVHPRVCGEQLRSQTPGNQPSGSSPRVRGTGRKSRTPDCSHRFIPACAGNRTANRDFYGGSPVHPRVCGEQFVLVGCPRYCGGSSPRVRGTVP